MSRFSHLRQIAMRRNFTLAVAAFVGFAAGYQVAIADDLSAGQTKSTDPQVIVMTPDTAKSEVAVPAGSGAAWGKLKWDTGQWAAVSKAIETAKMSGYDVAMVPTSKDVVDLKFVKLGWSDDTHGLLARKWAQKIIVDVSYDASDNGMT